MKTLEGGDENSRTAASRRCRTSSSPTTQQGLRRAATRPCSSGPPRAGRAMERADLLRKNGPIFVGQGKAIAKNAASDVRILVVGNPCNTNCLDRLPQRQGRSRRRWHAMTRLDHNRAVAALATKAGVANEAVTCMTIWGNHSNTQYPDFTNAKINGKPATSVITDRAWLENTLRAAVPGARQGDHRHDAGLVVASRRRTGPSTTSRASSRGTPADDWTSAADRLEGRVRRAGRVWCSATPARRAAMATGRWSRG